MSYSLNSLKGVIWGIILGTTIGVIKGDTRSLDYSSNGAGEGCPRHRLTKDGYRPPELLGT